MASNYGKKALAWLLVAAALAAPAPGLAARATREETQEAVTYGYTKPAGWIQDEEGRYFYTDSQGEMVYGWIDWNGDRYYVNETLGMVTGEYFIDGLSYYFDEDGALIDLAVQSGWKLTDEGWIYIQSDGSLAKGWQKIKGVNYYLDPTTGIMATGWRYLDGTWCFFQPGGTYTPTTPLKDWVEGEDGWHFFNADGEEQFGWILDRGVWYYVDRVQGLLTSNYWYLAEENKWYRFNADGAMISMPVGWVHVGRGWIYRYADGSHATGWKTIGGKTYFLNTYMGIMASGAVTIEGVQYKFDADGALISSGKTGWVTYGDSWRYYTSPTTYATGWKTIGGKRYYLDPSNGRMAKGTIQVGGICYLMDPVNGNAMRGWQKDEYGHWYYLYSDSSFVPGWIYDKGWYYIDLYAGMLTGVQSLPDGHSYFLASSGKMGTGWCLDSDGTWYYANADGALQTGWLTLNGRTYYLCSDFKMATRWEYIDGAWYYFDPVSGAMAVNTVINGYTVGADGAWIPGA